MKPRSGAPSRHSSLISLSSDDERRTGLALGDQLKRVITVEPADDRSQILHRGRVERELATRDDRLVAQIDHVHAAVAIDLLIGFPDREERRPPAAPGAEMQELVDGAGGVLRRADRIARHHRDSADIEVGDQRPAIMREVIVLVTAQSEVVERVVAPGPHDPFRVLSAFDTRRLRLDERSEHQVQEHQ